MEQNLSNISKILVNDSNFLEKIDDHIQLIMNDGKIDMKDIPEIMMLVSECYNNLKKVKVTYEELPNLFEEVIDFILDKYKLIDQDNEDEFKSMINVAIKLIMLKPGIKKQCFRLKKFICK